MALNVTKIRQTEEEDIFSYRDDYNEEKTVRFPRMWGMTEEEVEEYLDDQLI